MTMTFEEVKGILELICFGAALGGGWTKFKSLNVVVDRIDKKIHNGMSEALIRLEDKVDNLPCKVGECK